MSTKHQLMINGATENISSYIHKRIKMDRMRMWTEEDVKRSQREKRKQALIHLR